MSNTIILNSTNLVPGSNNTQYSYRFPTTKYFKDASISLSKINIYFSWINISQSLYNNNSFQYKWFDSNGVLNQTHTVTIPDGFYSTDSLNLFFQAKLKANLHYLQNADLTQRYYFSFVINETYYGAQINCLSVPSALPAGCTKPNGATWNLPASPITPQIIFQSTNNFNKILGFSQGTYPATAQSTDYSIVSNILQQIMPVSSVVIRCNACKNELALPNDVLYTFTQGNASYGDIIDESPNLLTWVKMVDGQYSEIILTFVDQNFNNLFLKDSQLLIVLQINEPLK